MRIIRKLSIRLIIFQCLALHLFGNAVFRFYYFLNADLYECLFKSDPKLAFHCIDAYPNLTLGSLIEGPIYFTLFGLGLGGILIIIVNRVKRKSFLNTLLVLFISILLMIYGGFSNRYLDSWIYLFGQIFSSEIWLSNLIASLTSLVLGSALVWQSVMKKN